MLNVTDLFCGSGGSSTGAAAVPGVELRRAINHWDRAIESHAANHPDVNHALCDLIDVHPAAFESMDILLASPECRTHSTARGTKRRGAGQMSMFERRELSAADVRSRVTMSAVVQWASVHRPQAIVVENVVEVMHWNDETGSFPVWLREIGLLGYEYQLVFLNAMHTHGLTDEAVRFVTPQTRDRIYIVFWRRGNPRPDLAIFPLAWCEGCEGDVRSVQAWKNGRRAGKYRAQYVYRCPACTAVVEPYVYGALNVIDWSRPMQRVGDRDLAFKPATEARLRAGLRRHGLRSYLVETGYSHAPASRTRDVRGPLPAQTARPSQMLVKGFIAPNRTNNQPDVIRISPNRKAVAARGKGYEAGLYEADQAFYAYLASYTEHTRFAEKLARFLGLASLHAALRQERLYHLFAMVSEPEGFVGPAEAARLRDGMQEHLSRLIDYAIRHDDLGFVGDFLSLYKGCRIAAEGGVLVLR